MNILPAARNMLILSAIACAINWAWKTGTLPSDADETIPSFHAKVKPGLCGAPAARSGALLDTAVKACLLKAEQATSEEERTAAVLVAEELLREPDPDSADQLLIDRAAEGEVRALTAYGSVVPSDETDALRRREALFAAEALGDAEASSRLEHSYRQQFLGKALARPQMVIALAEGRSAVVGDSVDDRRYLHAVAQAAMASCPFEAPVFETNGFRTAMAAYEAPIRAGAHAELVAQAVPAAKTFLNSLTTFASDLTQAGYQASASRLFGTVVQATQTLNQAASTSSAAGARDGARLQTLVGGCGQPEMLRVVKALQSIFALRSAHEPGAAVATTAPRRHLAMPMDGRTSTECLATGNEGLQVGDGAAVEGAIVCLRQLGAAGQALEMALAARAAQADHGGLVDRSDTLIVPYDNR